MVGGAYFEMIINGTFSQQREGGCRRIGNPIPWIPFPFTNPNEEWWYGVGGTEPNKPNKQGRATPHHTTII